MKRHDFITLLGIAARSRRLPLEEMNMWRGLISLCLALICLGNPASGEECAALPPAYAGPIFDASVQSWNPSLQGLIDNAPGAGVKRIALFANNRAGGIATAEAVLVATRTHPDLIMAGAPKLGFIYGGDLPINYQSSTLAGIKDGSYSFIGEILYTHGDKPDHRPTPHGEVYVDPLAAGTTRLLAALHGKTVPLLTHWEAWAWDRDWPRFDRLYSGWPQQRFVLPSLAYGSPEQADTILSAHRNVWGIISRLVDGRYRFVDQDKQDKLGKPMFDHCGALLPEWRAVLLKHSERLVYGSDEYANARRTWYEYSGIISRYRKIAGQLPAAVTKEISWDNAGALYGSK
jgi:hypothetical protein